MKPTEFIRCARTRARTVRAQGCRSLSDVLELFIEYDTNIAEKRDKNAKRMKDVRAHVHAQCVHIEGVSETKERSPIPPKEILSVFSSLSQEPLKKDQDSGCAREREFFEAYNVCAKELGWTVARKLTKPRAASIRRCIDDAGSLEKAFEYLNDFANSKHASGFGAGVNDSEWVIGIDYVIRAGKWIEIMEGKFNGVRAKEQGTTNGYGGNGHAQT